MAGEITFKNTFLRGYKMGGLIETNSKGPKPLTDSENAHIHERGKQLHEFYLKHIDETIKYLLYVNAGGAVTILAFMGALESMRDSICLQIALLCYALGVMCVGLLRVILLYKVKYLFESWSTDSEKCRKGDLEYNKLTEDDENRSDKYSRLPLPVGWACFLMFIFGLVFSAIGLFTQC